MNKLAKSFLAFVVGGLTGAGICYFVTNSNEPAAHYTATDNVKLADIRQNLKTLKQDLRDAGKYKCCIKGDCNWCAIQMEHCSCDELVQKKGAEESCPECAAAWNNKQGKIPGVDPDAIRVTTFGIYSPDGHSHEHQESGGHNESSHHGPADDHRNGSQGHTNHEHNHDNHNH